MFSMVHEDAFPLKYDVNVKSCFKTNKKRKSLKNPNNKISQYVKSHEKSVEHITFLFLFYIGCFQNNKMKIFN